MKTFSNIEAIAKKNAKKAQERYEERKTMNTPAFKQSKIEAFRKKCQDAVDEMRYDKHLKDEMDAYMAEQKKGN